MAIRSLKARTATQFVFRVEDASGKPATDMQLYMGMVGHAEFVSDDASVFAHVHPDGSVPMAALMLTKMPVQHRTPGDVPAAVSHFPMAFQNLGATESSYKCNATDIPKRVCSTCGWDNARLRQSSGFRSSRNRSGTRHRQTSRNGLRE